PASYSELSGFSLPWRLFPDFPMLERVNMTTLRATPCPFLRIRIPLMNHLDNQVAVQAHRWFAVHVFALRNLPHVLNPPLLNSTLLLAIRFPGGHHCRISNNPRFYWTYNRVIR